MVGWMPGFFDIEERLRELSAKGDDLECIKGLVNFGKFRADLEAAVPRADRSRGGRSPFDHVLMFKVLILQTMHALFDERCEYLIKDRLSFMRFLGLGLADPVPDANTIWTFREALTRATLKARPVTTSPVQKIRINGTSCSASQSSTSKEMLPLPSRRIIRAG